MATRFFQLKAPISAYIEKSTDRKVKLLTLTPMEWDSLQQMIGVLTAPHLVSLKVRLIHARATQLLICLVFYRLRKVDQGQLLHACWRCPTLLKY